MRLSKTFPPLACGVPVIYAGVGESADIIRNNDCGIVALPENPVSLADAVLSLVDAPQKRESFSKAGLKLVEREFSWKTIVCNWLNQLERSEPTIGCTPPDERNMVAAQVYERESKSHSS
jgi:glycosyltransferase involved in cell wall biosynthesis